MDRDVRADLVECGDEGNYPVDVSYGDLTGGAAKDVVVNVMTCGEPIGVATYVYRFVDGRYVHVYEAEEPPVYAEIDRGELLITRQFYGQDDVVSQPSAEEMTYYRWEDGQFKVKTSTRNDYSNAVGDPQDPAAQN